MSNEVREAVKEAAKEWLDQKINDLGRWTLKTLGAFVLISVLILLVKYGR